MLAACPSFTVESAEDDRVRVRPVERGLGAPEWCVGCGHNVGAVDSRGRCPRMVDPQIALEALLPPEALAARDRPQIVLPPGVSAEPRNPVKFS